MNADHERFAQWDAAYVLGALSAEDRRAFEAHCDECPLCRAAIAEIAPVVGLLSRVPADAARSLDDGPGAQVAAGLVSLAAARARRSTRRLWLGIAAAVAVVVAAVGVPLAIGGSDHAGQVVALSAVAEVPLEAQVTLTSVAWGTRLDLDCRYPDVYVADVPEGGWTYELAVIDRAGTAETVSTWRAGPGTSARLSAGTALDAADIGAIEIRSAKGAVLMRYDVGGE